MGKFQVTFEEKEYNKHREELELYGIKCRWCNKHARYKKNFRRKDMYDTAVGLIKIITNEDKS
jgi:hypothetical protein